MNGNVLAKVWKKRRERLEENPYVLIAGRDGAPDYPVRVLLPFERQSDEFSTNGIDYLRCERLDTQEVVYVPRWALGVRFLNEMEVLAWSASYSLKPTLDEVREDS